MLILIGEKWKGDDAVYRKKVISSLIVELIGGTDRGAMIRIWKLADPSDVVSAEKLPHVFDVTPDKNWAKQDEVYFMHFANAAHVYREIKTVKDAVDLMFVNR